jgi:uncharacterized protein YjiS (DUF1127 family)
MIRIYAKNTESASLPHAIATLRLWAAAIAAALRTWWRLGNESAQLRGLRDYELRDIGISRVDAWAASRQPRWEAVREAAAKVLRDGGVS